jgi:hypothetical protein
MLTRGAPIHAALASDGGGAHASASARATPPTPHCAAGGLRVSLGAGHRVPGAVTRYALEFTNVSGAACTLAGYPEVAAYRGDGIQVGPAAARGSAARGSAVAARPVLLAPGQSAHAVLDLAAPVARCRPVRVSGLSVAVPGETGARYVKRPLTTCAARAAHGQGYLLVQAIQPGAGPGQGGGAGTLADVRARPGGARQPASGAT